MKSLLGRLIKRQPSTNAADLSWLAELNQREDIPSIEFATQKLKTCLEQEDLPPAERLKFVLAVDTENRQRIRKIRQQFVSFENMRPELETRVAETIYLYLRQIFIAYRSMIEFFLDTNSDPIFAYDRLPVVLGRTLDTAYSMARWRYYRQQSVPDTTWPEIYGLFRILEQESLLDLNVPLYHGEPETHLAAAFIQACMLDSLESSSLNKKQTDLAAQLLQELLPWCSISKHHDEQRHLFHINLAGRSGARRLRLHQPNPDCRYWETDPLIARIDTAIQALEQGVPHDLNRLGKTDDILDTLRLMRSEWCRTEYTRQRRRQDRQKVMKQAIASHGYRDVCDHLKNTAKPTYSASSQNDEHSLDDKLRRHHSLRTAPSILYHDMTRERWTVSDESSGGFGVTFGDDMPYDIRLGRLVGLAMEDQPGRVMVGSIRNIRKSAKGENRVGIRIISRQPAWVQIRHASAGTAQAIGISDTSERYPRFPAIHLPGEEGVSETPSLLLPRIEYLAGGTYQVFWQAQPTLVRLSEPVEAKDDWVQVSYHPV